MANKLQCLSPEEIMKRLTDAGVLPTAQRLAIAQYVLCEADHPTAEEVEEGVKNKLPMVSKATVYNTLGKLVEVGLLREVRSPHEESLRYDGNLEPHHHFIDRDTGEIVDIGFGDVEISNIDSLKRKFKIEHLTVTIEGSRRSRG
jgi:Fur family iron response transcriptional regulator